MILSGLMIEEEVKRGNININPYEHKLLNPNSYNYRLNNKLIILKDDVLDPFKKQEYDEIIIPENGYMLMPNKLYLGSTYESIGSNKYVTQLIGRSSIGRLGLFLQVTAPIGHVGCDGHWTLELKCVQPLIVYPLMSIGQVTFWQINGDTELNYKHGRYGNKDCALPTKFIEEILK